MINKLLWKDKNKWQIGGAVIGAFIGLLMLLSAVQFYFDIQTIVYGDAGNSTEYVMLNKKVTLYNTIGGASGFTQEEVDKVKAQSFIQSVGEFTANQFKVSASSSTMGFYTELFFEAVPDEFVDVKTRQWKWEKGDKEIPIIISKDYLALYNFGFAPSQGLPQFTQNTIKKVSFTITLRGNGRSGEYTGRIVGFSDRINSIIVPMNFMEWANQQFGSSTGEKPSRLIVQTDNPYSQEFDEFLKETDYELSSGKLIGGQLKTVLNVLVSIIAVIGLVIVFLSLLIFMLNFQLIISQSSHDIRRLLQLGYKHLDISNILSKNLLMLFGGVLLSTFVVLFGIRYFSVGWFADQGFNLPMGFAWGVYVVALAFAGLFVVLNVWSIRKSVIALAK